MPSRLTNQSSDLIPYRALTMFTALARALGTAFWDFTEMYMGIDDASDTQENDKQPIHISSMLEKEDSALSRVKHYEENFAQLLAKARQLNAECTEEEVRNAKNIFFVHNLIEEACYDALPKMLIRLNIQSDTITPQDSRMILAYLKDAAHVELRKDGGYTKKGREMITPAQFSRVLSNIATVIHDRDTRLTDARYSSLTDLCVALDDHNSYIKNLLFKSWFRCEALSWDAHLPMIKAIVNFNPRMTAQLGFDFERTLNSKKEYYDVHHECIREIESPTKEKSALKFVNVTEVRARFNEPGMIETLSQSGRETPLIECLEKECAFPPEEITMLIEQRRVPSPARFGLFSQNVIGQPPLILKTISVGEFLDMYFPEQTCNLKTSGIC